MAAADWIGGIAATCSVLSFSPQAWKIIRERRTEGLSAAMYGLTSFGFACWPLFGFLKREWTVLVPNAICLCFALFIFAMILLPPDKTREVAQRLDPE
jgi:MtN3 and saliva related transmembrane protein